MILYVVQFKQALTKVWLLNDESLNSQSKIIEMSVEFKNTKLNIENKNCTKK